MFDKLDFITGIALKSNQKMKRLTHLNPLAFKKVMFIYLLSCFFSNYAQTITINSTNYKQTIDMMGGDMERSSAAVQSSKNTQEIIDWGFKDIGFNYCRIQYDKNQEMVEGTKNWGFYSKQLITMKQIKAVNPNIRFFATMRTDYDGFGNENNMPDWIVNYTTKKIEIDKYANFLVDFLEYMHNQGVTIHTLSITKEWTSFVYASRAKNIIPKLHAECDARGIPRATISDQGFWSMKQGMNYMNDVATLGTADLYDSFCTHDYDSGDTTTWPTVINKATSLGKKMYHDEMSTGAGAATSGVEPAMSKPIGVYIERVKAYDAGLSGEIFFEIWSRGVNRETRAIYSPWQGTGTRLRGYYLMKQFANNILDSKYITTTTAGTSNVFTMAFRKDNKMVLWVINKSTNTYAPTITLDASLIQGNIQCAYWTNSTNAEGATSTYIASGNTFRPSIEGESMNCYVFDVYENPTLCTVSSNTLIEAECFTTMNGIQTETCSEGGLNIGYIQNGDWTMYHNIDLSTMASINARIASRNASNSIEVRIDSLTGTLIGTIPVSNTGNYQLWKTDQANIQETTGLHNVYFVFKGGSGYLFNVNSFGFSDESILITSIDEELNLESEVYPNPFSDSFVVALKDNTTSVVEVFNSLGQRITSYTTAATELSVDLKDQKSGFYIVKITNNSQVITREILKR